MSEEAGGTAQPGAHVEHPAVRADLGLPRQRLDGGEPTVVIVIPLAQILGRQGTDALAVAAQRLHHLRLVDRMPLVEVDDGGKRLAHERQV